MFTDEAAVTAAVATWKVAVEAPGGTVTVETTGYASAGLLLESVTVTPDAGAGPPRVTGPCTVVPPITDAGATVARARSGGLACVFRSSVAVVGFSSRRSLEPLPSTSAAVRLAFPAGLRSTGTLANCELALI